MTDLFIYSFEQYRTQIVQLSGPVFWRENAAISLVNGKSSFLGGKQNAVLLFFIIGDGLFVTCTLCKHEFEIKFEFILNLLEFLLN